MKFKKLTATLLSVFALSQACYAQDVQVSLNGNIVNFPSQQALIVENRTLIPVRGLFDEMGYSIDWNNDTKVVTLQKDGKTIKLTIGESSYSVNGNELTLDVPAQIINERTMIPLRAISEATGCQVLWDNDKKIATVIDESIVENGGVVINLENDSEVDFLDKYNAITNNFSEKSTQFANETVAIVSDQNNFKTQEQYKEALKKLQIAVSNYRSTITQTKQAINALPDTAKFAKLKTAAIDYIETFEEFALNAENLCNSKITFDEFSTNYNKLGTELALKEAKVNDEMKALAA
ncbi:MAG: copper amine oxidase N-terminal domain-containing protein [Firmicutes bacterium]|nr:copper amine oxidase N-terminal domain-containing protein [Bacillota bacterium]